MRRKKDLLDLLEDGLRYREIRDHCPDSIFWIEDAFKKGEDLDKAVDAMRERRLEAMRDSIERAGGLPNTPGTPGYDSGGFRPTLEGGILKRKPNPGNDPAPRSSRSYGPTEESQDISGDYSGL